jgi:hypothetical protein
MTDAGAAPTRAALAEHLRQNPDTTAPAALGKTGADPSVWRDVVEDALKSDDPHLTLETPDVDAPVPGGGDR